MTHLSAETVRMSGSEHMAPVMATTEVLLCNGVAMPLVGLGTWKSKDAVVGDAVKAAVAAGYRHIDCAHCYDNEHEVGAALQELFAAGTVKREDLFIVSKLWNTKHEERDVERALRHTLTQLSLDYVDLYLVHWPFAFRRMEGLGENFPRRTDGSGPEYDFEAKREDGSDGLVDPSETWRGMEGVYRKGLARGKQQQAVHVGWCAPRSAAPLIARPSCL